MYSPEIPDNLMHNLWILKRYCAEGPIAKQLRKAIEEYLLNQVKKLGCPIEDVEEVVERYEREKREPSREGKLS
jgi:hypothetical protein